MDPNEEPKGVSTQRTETEPPAPTPVPLEPPAPNVNTDTKTLEPGTGTPAPEQESNPLGSDDKESNIPTPVYLGLSYRSSNEQSQLELVLIMHTDREIDAKRQVSDRSDWFAKATAVRVDTEVDVELMLIQQSRQGERPTYEASEQTQIPPHASD